MTLEQLLKAASKELKTNNVDESEASARYIIAHAAKLGYSLSVFNSKLDHKLTPLEFEIFQSSIQKRIFKAPVQYIVGDWDFYGLTLRCKSPILIPRPETEELVERIIGSRVLKELSKPTILDIGSGTGAIGIALLSQIPTATCIAIDINKDAVELSNNNAETIFGSEFSSRYICIHSSVQDFIQSNTQTFDIIVSNPPYIPTSDLSNLPCEVKDYEDRIALDGGEDGLDIIRLILQHSSALLRVDGPRELWLEVSEHHPAMLAKETDRLLEEYQCELLDSMRDLAGHPRFVRFKFR
eukprot:CAMPEP_0201103940 /NCGR_PEP_ID=MMETSP0812-20130820/33938_1 /ASSEMBLY_ACC=CAM_ASM_000668 /TAXON_ID=98059 /ORGANISM="Dinobryon sp., Strain UTEXLB2267" /LENGTH=296 /DNA_ID=CAMNT_0047362685 /DNA_START=71 /DNA_END=961 /DNA_ORIENTATION=-